MTDPVPPGGLPPNMITGYPVQASSHMVGCKRAVLMDGVVYVSPAMLSLIRSAVDSDELGRLLAAIKVLDLGNPTRDLMCGPWLVMTKEPPHA